jgi:hypothetical protein
MKRPGRKPRAKKARRGRGKPANRRRKGVSVAKRKRKAEKKATRKHTSGAQSQLDREVQAIVNGGRLVGPGGDDDPRHSQ